MIPKVHCFQLLVGYQFVKDFFKMRPPSQYPQEIAQEADENESDPRFGAMMICTKLAGRAVIRVIGRCNDAKENENLGEWELVISDVCDK